ncbi:hypothetical protein CEXT_75511 [Caerostris extrusa]|uniref:Uncharacterized protein n=1 Tax=Caerostris extrusa TaxID=172846 RepID=A0AAV4XV93_CAEEX|nr:hypothetical protein CEXT_75511 [Caerostris extrusa]
MLTQESEKRSCSVFFLGVLNVNCERSTDAVSRDRPCSACPRHARVQPCGLFIDVGFLAEFTTEVAVCACVPSPT